MKKTVVGPPPIVNARWLNGGLQPKAARIVGPPPIVNARWSTGAVQAKPAARPGPPPPAYTPAHNVSGTAILPKKAGAAVATRSPHQVHAPMRPGIIQRAAPAALAQAAPPFVQIQCDWAGSVELEPLREWRGEDGQEWLAEEIRIRKQTEGSDGNPETFDAFIARNYAIVELTTAAGATYVGRGVSAGAGPGIHGERAAFRDAVRAVPAAPNYDWTQADHASLWLQKGVRVSRIWSDRELCTGANSCFAWAGSISGGNGIATTVYYGVTYSDAGKRELRGGIRSQLKHYLSGEEKEYFEHVTRQ